MDDTAQKLKDQTQVVQPVSVAHKEGEPIVNPELIITRSEQEPNLHPEVSQAEVKVVKETLELNDSHKAVGIQPAGASVPVPTESVVKIKLPLTEDQAEQVINTQKHDSAIAEHTEGIYRTNSIYGLAILVRKIFSKMHGRLIGSK